MPRGPASPERDAVTSSLRRGAVILFTLLVASQVGVVVFSLWEPTFDGQIDYQATVDLGEAYWPMNVLLGGPSYAIGFVVSAVFLAVLGEGSRVSLAGSVLLGVAGIVFALVITAEVLPFAWAADTDVVSPTGGRELFEAFNGELDRFVPYVVGSMAGVALGVLVAVLGATMAGGLPRWVLVLVTLLLVATFAAPMGSGLAVGVGLLERAMWIGLGWLGLRRVLREA